MLSTSVTGDFLRRLREEYGVTRLEVANIYRSMRLIIRDIESGKYEIHDRHINAYAEALGISPYTLKFKARFPSFA